MTVFVSYHPGAKGKFITEICDLSRFPNILCDVTEQFIIGGNIFWIQNGMARYLIDNGVTQENTHGIFGEQDNHKFYIDTVLRGLQTLNINFAVDTHYVEKCSLEYILKQGHKVIRLVVVDDQGVDRLQNNFFYKNFIEKESSIGSTLAKNIIKYCKSESFAEHIVKDFDLQFLDKDISDWDKPSLRILFDACGVFTKKKQDWWMMDDPNILEVNVTDLGFIDTLAQVITFAGGTMNKLVKDRIIEYNRAQKEITTFDEYIDIFINKNKQC